MNLVEVDVISAQTRQAGVDLVMDGLARQTATIGPWTHRSPDLGGDDELLTARKLSSRPQDR